MVSPRRRAQGTVPTATRTGNHSGQNAGLGTDYERHNRSFWDADADAYQALHDRTLRGAPLAWGVWRIPESELGVLGDLAGLEVLELGCGAAQWSIALEARGVRCVGLDLSLAQLRHARAGMDRLVLASANATPLRAASFDVVFCDHGALSFCDPDVVIPEVARILRPGGLLAFCHSSPLLVVCDDGKRVTRKLRRDYFGMRRFDWQGEGTIDFQLEQGAWIRVFRAHGFVVEDLIELRAPEGATTTYREYVDPDWARRWPAEQIWKVRKGAIPPGARRRSR
jgi:SAM-dependent methyltransferase